MTRDQALHAVRESIARGSCTPHFGEGREAYLAEKAGELQAALIDPVVANVVGENFAYGVAAEFQAEPAFAVARRNDSWLLYRPACKEFSLAFGASHTHLTILGFSSSDALEEWLG